MGWEKLKETSMVRPSFCITMVSDGITMPKWAEDGFAHNRVSSTMARKEHLFAVNIFPPFSRGHKKTTIVWYSDEA
jgi:hypothetical protein